MNKYELYEKSKDLKGFDIMGHCFISNGELFVYTLIGNGKVLSETENTKSYEGDFRLISVSDGNRWDDRNWNGLSVKEIVDRIEENYENKHDSVVYIGEPVFSMNLEGFDFVTLNVDYVGMEERE